MNRHQLCQYLKDCTSAEQAFPMFLHAQVPRQERLRFLKELASAHKVFVSPDNGTKYVLDYSIARELFSNPANGVRFTALLTDIESSEVEYIERVLEYFPVFSDDENYERLKPYALMVKERTETRLSSYDLESLISRRLDKVLNQQSNVDLLREFVCLNAEIALQSLGWQTTFTVDELITSSKQMFEIFSGTNTSVLTQREIEAIYNNLLKLSKPDLTYKCLGIELDDAELIIMSAIYTQWITGFITPCVTWLAYTFLRRFSDRIAGDTGNYSCPGKEMDYRHGCLRDFIPFQAIHRLITRDCNIHGTQFRSGDFACIIPDALFFSTKDNVVSAVIGAPERPCMGIHISSIIVEAFENYFKTIPQELVSSWRIEFDLKPSLSALEFSRIDIKVGSTN